MTITENTVVGDLAAVVPGSVRVFERHGVDFCCGGKKSLAAACDEAGLSFEDIAHEIEAEALTPVADERDWTNAPLHQLIDHIVRTYHEPLRADLPQLQRLAERVERAHASKSSAFVRVREVVDDLAADLIGHMMKEEVVLFPAIKRLEAGFAPGVPLGAPISVMQAEHDGAAAFLRELRSLTSDYGVPSWGCATLRALYSELEHLERELHVHVHLENNILFPRATASQLTVGGRA
jgi:regulator of cell morphogenesis and NO signaling